VPVPVQPVMLEVRENLTAATASGNGQEVANSAQPDQPPVQFELTPLDELLNGPMGVAVTHPPGSPEGVYQLDVRRPGTYQLDVRDFGQKYAASVSSGSADLTKEPLVVGPGGSCPPIEVTLRNDFGYLSGKLKAEPQPASASSGAPQIRRVLFPIISLSRHRIYMGFTGLSANFGGSLDGTVPLPPGDYLVLPFANNQQIDLDDQEAMSRLASQGQTVTIQPGATVEVEVDPSASDDGGGQ
jgi:hypothetical protein